MIEVSLKSNIPSIEDCCAILRSYTNEFGIPLDYDRLLEYYYYYSTQANERRIQVERYIGYKGDSITDRQFIAWLTKNNISTGFLATKGGEISLSGESIQAVISTGLYSSEINTLLKIYGEWKDLSRLVAPFKSIIAEHEVSVQETYDNHRMIITHPEWVPQNTGRIGMSNPALMNIAKELADIETLPKGWVYLTVDSGQIEPRIIQSAFLNDPQIKKCTMIYNDAYFGYVHYCTILTEEERHSGSLDIKPVELSDEIKAKREKFKTYGNAVMYGSTENREKDPDKEAFIRYIGGHRNRVTWQQEVEKKINSGKCIFETVFGTPIDITKGSSEDSYKDKTSNMYFKHLVRCAINNPIQGTAADLMRLSISRANSILARYATKSYILKYTHDSGTFAIHEDDYDKVADRLREVTSYQVADWIPIYGKAQEGIPQSGKLPRLTV